MMDKAIWSTLKAQEFVYSIFGYGGGILRRGMAIIGKEEKSAKITETNK
jgi:hypothetical protein